VDNPRVFQEYAQSDAWVAAHLGQFAGYLFAFAGLVVLCQLLLGERARATVAAYLGMAAAAASLAVAAVLQAVDGIALKALVDSWAQASGPQQAVAFGAAESVRWLEIGINSLFRLLQGTTLVVIGLALTLGERFPRWIGWLGIICGLALVLRGIAVAFVGFDLSNPVYFSTGVVTSLPVTLLNLWMAALAIVMWAAVNPPFHGSLMAAAAPLTLPEALSWYRVDGALEGSWRLPARQRPRPHNATDHRIGVPGVRRLLVLGLAVFLMLGLALPAWAQTGQTSTSEASVV
jgi:hypothetical protein